MLRKLSLGCGKWHIRLPGETTCDRLPLPDVDVVHDLDVTPWPFPDGSFYSVSALHLVEHLKSLLSFMDECHRIIAPGGSLYLETPLAGVDLDLEWADPTHVRCYRAHSFANYFTPEGVERFGYTDKAWAFVTLRPFPGIPGVLQVHGYPIKVPV